MPSKKTINVTEDVYQEFVKIKGSLIAQYGLKASDNTVMKALCLMWTGDSAEIEALFQRKLEEF